MASSPLTVTPGSNPLTNDAVVVAIRASPTSSVAPALRVIPPNARIELPEGRVIAEAVPAASVVEPTVSVCVPPTRLTVPPAMARTAASASLVVLVEP